MSFFDTKEKTPAIESEHGGAESDTRDTCLLAVREFCVESNEGRGIWKVIDEQRELLECLQKHLPETLRRCPWIEGWLARTDMFLVNLARLLDLPDTPPGMVRFPRPWPGSDGLEYRSPAHSVKTSARGVL